MSFSASPPEGPSSPLLGAVSAAPAIAAPAATPHDLLSIARALIDLTKPGVTRMVLATTWAGAVIAPGPIWNYARLAWAMFGTALIVASANALNMFLEADVDALMKRTQNRPLPSGRLSPETALWCGVSLAFIGIPVLDVFVNAATAFLGVMALLSYVLVYTPMKRASSLAVWVGAIPGAAPPLMGWTAMTGTISWPALSLFALLFIWQVPHFHAIAIFRADEYRRAGLRVLPNERGLSYTKRAIVVLLVVQFAVSALPALAGLGGKIYVAAAALLGAGNVAYAVYGLSPSAGPRWARTLFFASLPYLVVLFAVLVVGAT